MQGLLKAGDSDLLTGMILSNRHSASRYTLGYAKNVHFGEKALFGIPQPQQNYTNQEIVVPCTNGIENFSRPND